MNFGQRMAAIRAGKNSGGTTVKNVATTKAGSPSVKTIATTKMPMGTPKSMGSIKATALPKVMKKKAMDAEDRAEIKAGKKPSAAEERMEGKKHKNWIAGAIKHPGALHRELGVKAGNKIPRSRLAAAAKKPGTEGKRARLAETLGSFHKAYSAGAKAYAKRMGSK